MAFTKQVKESKEFWNALNDQVEEIIQLNKKDKKNTPSPEGVYQTKLMMHNTSFQIF